MLNSVEVSTFGYVRKYLCQEETSAEAGKVEEICCIARKCAALRGHYDALRGNVMHSDAICHMRDISVRGHASQRRQVKIGDVPAADEI